MDAHEKCIRRMSEMTVARSGAQYDRQKRADETAATVTGTSGEYAAKQKCSVNPLSTGEGSQFSRWCWRNGNLK
jgi:hypothetical protein